MTFYRIDGKTELRMKYGEDSDAEISDTIWPTSKPYAEIDSPVTVNSASDDEVVERFDARNPTI